MCHLLLCDVTFVSQLTDIAECENIHTDIEQWVVHIGDELLDETISVELNKHFKATA